MCIGEPGATPSSGSTAQQAAVKGKGASRWAPCKASCNQLARARRRSAHVRHTGAPGQYRPPLPPAATSLMRVRPNWCPTPTHPPTHKAHSPIRTTHLLRLLDALHHRPHTGLHTRHSGAHHSLCTAQHSTASSLLFEYLVGKHASAHPGVAVPPNTPSKPPTTQPPNPSPSPTVLAGWLHAWATCTYR